MRRIAVTAVAIGVAVAFTLGLGTAAASARGKLIADVKLTAHRPGVPTGGTLHLVWPNNGPDGRPKPEVKGVFHLPAGATINERAVPTCTASDAQLRVEGDAACPRGSFVGPGAITLLTGFGSPFDPFPLDDRWYHGPHQIFALFTPHGLPGPILAVNRVAIRGSTFVAKPSLPPGFPPTKKSVPKRSDQAIKRLVSAAGAFITTPPTCPASGKWVAHSAVTYDDGSVQRATSVTRCHD